MVEEEYISLHGCIGNTSSDAEDLTEHQLVAEVAVTGKECTDPCKTQRVKERKEK